MNSAERAVEECRGVYQPRFRPDDLAFGPLERK
jgi:hypothetical protein